MKIFDASKLSHLPCAVLFDTDNTLYDYSPAHDAALEAVKEKFCSTFSIKEDEFFRNFQLARQGVKARLGKTASSHSRLLYIQSMLEMMGFGSQIMWALDFEQTYWRTFLTNTELFENVTEALEDLKRLGIPTAIITDLTAQIQFRKVVYFGLDHHFDYIITSEEAGFDKPHEAPFKLALEKMKPGTGNIWMIGDNAVNDIQGAREQINAVTIQKIHKGVKVGRGDSRPDCVINNFSEFRKLLKNIIDKNGS